MSSCAPCAQSRFPSEVRNAPLPDDNGVLHDNSRRHGGLINGHRCQRATVPETPTIEHHTMLFINLILATCAAAAAIHEPRSVGSSCNGLGFKVGAFRDLLTRIPSATHS